MNEKSQAVFLSYASQDADAARRICEALRPAGVEVWFDQNELVGGDAWDAKIRRQIGSCALFVPVISANTQARREGYFRIEWRIAAQRTHAMSDDTPFLLPIVIDDTRDAEARVPAEFKAVQWTRMPQGAAPERFSERVKVLLNGDGGTRPPSAAREPKRPRAAVVTGGRRPRPFILTLGGLMLATSLIVLAFWQSWSPRAATQGAPANDSNQATAAALTKAQQLVAQAKPLFEAWDFATDRDLKLADQLLKEATQLEPMNGEAWAAASVCSSALLQFGYDRSPARYEAVRRQTEHAMRLAPASLSARIAQAYSLRWEGAAGVAEAELRFRELAGHPAAGKFVVRSWGTTLAHLRRDEEAIDAFERAGALPGGDPIAHYNRANALYRLERDKEGDAALDQAIALRPDYWYAHQRKLWRLVFELGDVKTARMILDNLPVSFLREDRSAAIAAQVRLRGREPGPCIAALERAGEYIESNYYTGPKRYLIGMAHQIAGRSEAARVEWLAALREIENRVNAQPTDADLRAWRARLLALTGDREKAAAELELLQQQRAVVFREATRSTWEVYAALGRAKETLHYFQTVLRVPVADRARTLAERTAAATVLLEPLLDPFRRDAEFQTLLLTARTAQTGSSPFAEAAMSAAPLAKADPKSVAVLAFDNLSDDKANEYFSDGISEELLTVLQKVPGLRLAARTSAFSFKGKDATVREVGEKLGVAHVVSGSVQKIGNRVKITVRLSRASTNEESWARSFPPLELTDVFALQSEIALAIVSELRGWLTAEPAEVTAQIQAAAVGATRNVEAHELHLRGKFLANQFSLDSLRRAEEVLRRAVALDPEFAQAWATLAKVGRARSGFAGTRGEADAGFQLAREASAHAVKLAPRLAEAHLARLHYQLLAFDWKGAVDSLRRVKELSPDEAYASEVRMAAVLGESERAVEAGKRAVVLDPVNPQLRVHYGWALLSLRRFGEAEAEFRRAAELSGEAPYAHAGAGIALLLQGRAAEATAEVAREATGWTRRFARALTLWGEGRRTEADGALDDLVRTDADTGACQIAEVHAFRGEADRSFEWLERALRQRDPGLISIKTDPLFDALRGDARWPVLLRKIGLSDEQLK